MRRIPLVLAFALVLSACDGGSGGTGSPRPSRPNRPDLGPSETETPPAQTVPQGPLPAPGPDVQVPEDAPTSLFEPGDLERIAAGDLRIFVPPEGRTAFAEVLATPEHPIDQVAVSWRRGTDPLALERGFVVWQRFDDHPSWRAIYAFTFSPEDDVSEIRVHGGDANDDGVPDLVTYTERASARRCGLWRVFLTWEGEVTEAFRRQTCDAAVRTVDGHLVLQQAVYGPDDPRCCPRGHRFTALEWNGQRFVKTDSWFEELPTGPTSQG